MRNYPFILRYLLIVILILSVSIGNVSGACSGVRICGTNYGCGISDYVCPDNYGSWSGCSFTGYDGNTYNGCRSGQRDTDCCGNNEPNYGEDCEGTMTQCSNGDYQTCSGCLWQANQGTDSDSDGVDTVCGDSTCDNAAGVCDTAVSGKCVVKTATEIDCADGLDNDCNGDTDCEDENCRGVGSDPDKCCQDASLDCTQDDCVIESCGTDNKCDYTDRAAGVSDECSTCNACDKAGGNCAAITENDGKNCVDDCTYCHQGSCLNRAAGSTAECSTCQQCDSAGGNCEGITAETGKNCNGDCYDCIRGTCSPRTEGNDGTCNDDCTSCIIGDCKNRNQCDSTECSAGKYCDSAGGDCKTPDENSNVCLNCVSDQTSGYSWSWTPSNHEDSGKNFSADLFNSNAAPCSAASGGPCYNSNGNPVNHKSPLTSGNCCGDDANEFYKSDYYGPECTSSVDDCVWSTGDSQTSGTGNAGYWCYEHEWHECKDSTISTKISGVTCVGTTGNTAWTINSEISPEDQYSCSDTLDNDGDTFTDCDDSDCLGATDGGPGGITCCAEDRHCRPSEKCEVKDKKCISAKENTDPKCCLDYEECYALLNYDNDRPGQIGQACFPELFVGTCLPPTDNCFKDGTCESTLIALGCPCAPHDIRALIAGCLTSSQLCKGDCRAVCQAIGRNE